MIKRNKNKFVSFNKLRLHSAEKNSDWNEKIFKSFLNTITQEDIKYYPNNQILYERIAQYFKVSVENIILCHGSDRAIKYFFESNNEYNSLIISNPTYPMYKVYGELFGMKIQEIEYESLEFPIDKYLNKITPESVCVFSNPNTPIADLISTKSIKSILDYNIPTLVDECYSDFSENFESFVPYIDDYENLFVCKSFSKSFGSAGVRFGIIFSSKKNIQNMLQYRDAHELNGLTIKWVDTLLNNIESVEEYIYKVKSVRNILITKLKQKNYDVIKTDSNWIYIRGDYEIPSNIILRDFEFSNKKGKWLRLQVTDDINDYNWILL